MSRIRELLMRVLENKKTFIANLKGEEVDV